jgi:hypothetical protein
MQTETWNIIIGFLGALLGGIITSFTTWLNQSQADKRDERRIELEREKLNAERDILGRHEKRANLRADRDEILDVVFKVAVAVHSPDLVGSGNIAVVTWARTELMKWLVTVPTKPELRDQIARHLEMDNDSFAATVHELRGPLAKAIAEMNPSSID